MALSLAKVPPLMPEIKLAQALSEFEAVLPDEQKTNLRKYRGQSPPNSTDVIRLTAEIDRDMARNRRCVGTRFTNVLHAVQQFSTVVDSIVGSSQSQLAGAIWGTMKVALLLFSAKLSCFDRLSILFMIIGVKSPRYQDFGLLYHESRRLQNALCEYFVVIVRLCKQAVVFLKKPFWSQLSSSTFESAFGGFQQDLEDLASAIHEEVFRASNQTQQNEAKEMSSFRAFARAQKRKGAAIRFLDACSTYNHETSWKQARKRGNTNWIRYDKRYEQWKGAKISCTLWCTGILGSGKTVLSANVVEDLKITTSEAVAYFFCRGDDLISLETRTIIGSIARQIFDHIKLDNVDAIAEMRLGTLDTDDILYCLQALLPSNPQKYFIVIDGLDECKEKDTRLLLECLKQLLTSKHDFHVYCSSRPHIGRWEPALLEPQWNISISQTSSSADIEEYVKATLVERLESGSFAVGDSAFLLTIQEALLKNAHGVFLWVALQIDFICSQKTDEAIRTALENLPEDLQHIYDRIFRKLHHSNAADPRFYMTVFALVAAAERPLTLEELREAVSVTPGKTSWDESRLVNDMFGLLLESCGNLVAIDEERMTVHFAHPSVKDYLLSEPTNSDMRKFHINMEEANLYLGEIIVTYLNFGIFDQQLAEVDSQMLPHVKNHPSALIGESLPGSSYASRLAVRLLNSAETYRSGQFQKAAVTVDGYKEQTEPAHPFFPYAQEYWLFHTRLFNPVRVAGYSLWENLIDGEVKSIKLPWAPEESQGFGDKYLTWIMQNEHWALIERSLVEFTKKPNEHNRDVYILFNFLAEKTMDMDFQNIPSAGERAPLKRKNYSPGEKLGGGAFSPAGGISFEVALYLASLLHHERVVLLSLRKGANVDAEGGFFGTALQAASATGNEEIARLLLENGAKVNANCGYYGNALNAASDRGHEKVVERLMAAGANINSQVEESTAALHPARLAGNEKVVDRLRMAEGADFSAQSGNLWEKAALNHAYKDVWRLVQDIKDADLQELSISLRFEFEVPAVISLGESQLESKQGHLVDDMLLNHVVLVKRTATDGNSKQITRLEALTCLEYMMRRWGPLGEQILRDVSTLSKSQSGSWLHKAYKNTNQSPNQYSLNFHDSYLSVNIDSAVLDHELGVFISALDWLCKAIRHPKRLPQERGFLVSSSCCRISHIETRRKATAGYDSSKSEIWLNFSLLAEPGPDQLLEHNCWQQLFRTCFVLEEEGLSEYLGPVGKGLEMSFDLMVSLAATEYPVKVNDRVVLVGYHTVLIPTQLEADYVQFHLEVDEQRQINPFCLDYSKIAQVTDYTRFKSKRCFVGWCEAAHIKLGTQRLPFTVRYSGAQEQRKTLHMTGVSAGGQVGSAAPIQAGVSGQATFSFLSHRLTFSPSSIYSKMLFDVSKQVVLISDVTAHRSWLVPKLSLILHMAHAWVVENILPHSTLSDPIPFADPHDDGIAVKEALERHGDIIVCGHGSDSFRLRSLVLGLNINLLATVSLIERSKHKSLYGFEFMDIVSEPGKGAFMKKIKIETGQSWLALANLADAVIICSELGEAMAPAEGGSRKNSTCNILPSGKGYLAAHLSCLGHLAHRIGGELASLPQDPKIALSRENSWTISGEPFETCTHDVHSKDTCWNKGSILQKICQKTIIHSLLSERTPSPYPRLCLKGAVVFGRL